MLRSYIDHTKPKGKNDAKRTRETSYNGLRAAGQMEPRGDAFKFHKELKENPKTDIIPLLVIDVRPEEHSRRGWRKEEGAQMCAEDYISRPIEPAELTELVGDILETATPKSPEIEHLIEHIEKVLKRMEKIEELLVR